MKEFFLMYDLPWEPTSNERLGVIPMPRVIDTLDRHYGKGDMGAAKRHIAYWIAEAIAAHDLRAELSLRNEEISYSLRALVINDIARIVSRIDELVEYLQLQEAPSVATVYHNIAVAFYLTKDNTHALIYCDKAIAIYRADSQRFMNELVLLYDLKKALLIGVE